MADIEPSDPKPVMPRGWLLVMGRRRQVLLRSSDVLFVTTGDDDLAVLHVRDGGRDNIEMPLAMSLVEVAAAIAKSEG